MSFYWLDMYWLTQDEEYIWVRMLNVDYHHKYWDTLKQQVSASANNNNILVSTYTIDYVSKWLFNEL